MISNADLAAEARRMAALGGPDRSSWLVIQVACATCRTVKATRKAITGPSVPPPITARAAELIVQLLEDAAA